MKLNSNWFYAITTWYVQFQGISVIEFYFTNSEKAVNPPILENKYFKLRFFYEK